MIGLLLLAGGGGRLGSCGLEAQECSGSRKRLQEGEEGEGEGGTRGGGAQARGFRTRKAGGSRMRANGLQESGLWVGGGSTSAADRVQGRDFALGEETQALGFRTRGLAGG